MPSVIVIVTGGTDVTAGMTVSPSMLPLVVAVPVFVGAGVVTVPAFVSVAAGFEAGVATTLEAGTMVPALAAPPTTLPTVFEVASAIFEAVSTTVETAAPTVSDTAPITDSTTEGCTVVAAGVTTAADVEPLPVLLLRAGVELDVSGMTTAAGVLLPPSSPPQPATDTSMMDAANRAGSDKLK